MGIEIWEHERLNPKLEVSDIIKDSLKLYANQGIEPGGFLSAVLENNLFDALGMADSYNRASLFELVQYIYDELPYDSWGSVERVSKYLDKFNPEEK